MKQEGKSSEKYNFYTGLENQLILYLSELVGALLGEIQNEKSHFRSIKFLQITRVTAFDNGFDNFQKSFRQQLRGFLVVGSVLRQKLSD
jgi:hypothetical protein